MVSSFSSVLIIGQLPDPHIQTVKEETEERGHPVFLLNRRLPGQGISVLIDSGEMQTAFRDLETCLDVEAIGAVWWRMKPMVSAKFGGLEFGQGGTQEQSFAWSEWKGLLRSLNELIPHAKWVNPIEAHSHIGKKIHQLKLATDIGLEVPDTIITNSALDAARLFKKHDRVIYKTLSSFIAPPNHIIFTNEISLEDLFNHAMELSTAPGIFQAYIEKSHELRVTVIEEDVFVVEVDSQDEDGTKTDWRRDQFADIFSDGELSDETESKLLEFHRKAGIKFGTYDFIVAKDGREVFLECNPGGQWLWLEEKLEHETTKLLVDVLTEDLKGGKSTPKKAQIRNAN